MTREPEHGARAAQERLIELGWLIVTELDPAEQAAVAQGRARMLERLRARFGRFEWRMPVVQRPESLTDPEAEPAELLQEGVEERDLRHWDFVFVVTRTDLKSYYKPYALAVPSRAIGVAVLSTARLAPQAEDAERTARMATRIERLGLHLLGDLNGLAHRDDATAFMYQPRTIDDLDAMNGYSQDEREDLDEALAEVSDLRLEEQPQTRRSGPLSFYLRAIAISAGDILSAVVQARPWEFPLRLSRLTAASISALFVMLMTAEAWDLGMRQPPSRVLLLSALVLLAASAFILKRQKLLLRRGPRRLSEQIVVTNVSIGIVVLLGLLTTYLMLFMLTLLLTAALYDRALIDAWAASLDGRFGVPNYLTLAGLVASLGIVIGSLGASFEGQQYFRHITYADEET